MKFIGIMTGNSLDAIDCVLTEFDNDKIHDICGHSAEIPPLIANDFRTLKQKLSQNGGDICSFYNTETKFFTNLHNTYIELVAQTVKELLKKANIQSSDIKAIGFHGQTCFHFPPSIAGTNQEPSTVQIGSGQMLANLTNIPVVFDFRSADIMNGGEGAPLAPVHNFHLTTSLKAQKIFPLAFCNGGNTGNITLISEDINTQEPQIMGWDTGPFNHFIDYLARTEQNTPCDKDGHLGKQGNINLNLLDALFQKSAITSQGANFIKRSPPKSSDPAWYKIIPELISSDIPFYDRIRTAERFSAYAFAYNLSLIPFNLRIPQNFLLFGGGWNNPIVKNDFIGLVRGQIPPLAKHINIFKKIINPNAIIESSDQYNLSGKYMEARIFADMAYCYFTKQPFSTPSTTGCKSPTIGGVLTTPQGNNKQLWSLAAKGWSKK